MKTIILSIALVGFAVPASASIFDNNKGKFTLTKVLSKKAKNGALVGDIKTEMEEGLTAAQCVAKADAFIKKAKTFSFVATANASCTYTAMYIKGL